MVTMDSEQFSQLIDRMDKLTEAITALVGIIAIQFDDQDQGEQNAEPETYLDGTPRR